MTHPVVLDVLIVYNGFTAASARDAAPANKQPFPSGSLNQSCNNPYSYLLEQCAKLGLSAGFTTSLDIIGPGLCRSYWTFRKNSWHKIDSPCYSEMIFDKFSPKKRPGKLQRKLLFSSKKIISYNDKTIYKMFFDKHLTYTSLSNHAIPTVKLGSSSIHSIQDSIDKLTRIMALHPGKSDFGSGFILKDRFGAGGWHVYKIKPGDTVAIQVIMQVNPNITFILQPFAKFDLGFSYKHQTAATDIRLLYLNGTIVQSYLRMAKSGDFRCNEHQGGHSTYLKLTEIPEIIRLKSDFIADSLPNNNSLYALDFIIANSGTPYFIEGNTGPGLSWNESVAKEKFMGRQLIRSIAQSLSDRVRTAVKTVPHYYKESTLTTIPQSASIMV